ncbi:MAG: hypothetical protein V7603_6018 [Micromonosporaceae bacterium]
MAFHETVASYDDRVRDDAERLVPLALSRPAEALALAGQVLARQPGARDASFAHQARAIVLRDMGRVDEAIADLRAALRLSRRAGQPARVLDVQATLGLTLGLAGRSTAGLALLDEAVSASTGVLAGRILMRRAYLRRVLGQHPETLADLRRAIALLHRGGDSIWEARSRSLRFLVHVALGQAGRADRDLAVAERLFAAAGQDLESAMAVHSRADVAFQTGDLPGALGFLDEAAARYEALSAPVPQLAIDRCGVLLAAGLATEAMAVTDEAIRRQPRGRSPSAKRAELLFAAARAAQAAGEPAAAVARAAAARALFQAQRRPWWQARASFVLLQSRYQAGERGGRLRAELRRIATRLEALGAEEASSAHLLAGRLAVAQGLDAPADRHLAAAARLRHRGPLFGRPAGWLAQALRAEAQGNARRTLIACRRGLEVAEQYQRTLGATELRAHAAGYGTELAAIGQRHAVRRGDARMLLTWSERWRASALAAPPARPIDDRGLAADLAALRTVMARLDIARTTGAVNPARLEQDRRRLEASIRSRARRTAGQPGSPGAAQWSAAEILDQLGDHRLVELVSLDGMLYAVTAADRRVRLHAVGPARDAARELDLARFLLRRLAHGRPSAQALATLDAAGRRLEASLLGPVAAELDGRPVVAVPPGRLHAVPWAILPSLRTTPVHVAPSAAMWLRVQAARPGHGRRLALVVGPGLAGTAAEVAKIGDGYPDSVILSNGNAVADRVLAALDGAWTAHVAAHGVFRAENALFSSLRLDDGPLTVYDLGRLRRAPFRLVLSSCESALAAQVASDELLGMVSALVPLGTASLLASVVPVNDAATAPFMVTFHARLRGTAGFADALVAARSEVTGDPVATATALSFVALGR